MSQEPKYSSLERSLQNVVVANETHVMCDSNSNTANVRKARRNNIRKLSVPASKLFPPGFFPDTNSVDSNKSPMKMSIDSGAAPEQQLTLTASNTRTVAGIKSLQM